LYFISASLRILQTQRNFKKSRKKSEARKNVKKDPALLSKTNLSSKNCRNRRREMEKKLHKYFLVEQKENNGLDLTYEEFLIEKMHWEDLKDMHIYDEETDTYYA
jgi:hypothetical protein